MKKVRAPLIWQIMSARRMRVISTEEIQFNHKPAKMLLTEKKKRVIQNGQTPSIIGICSYYVLDKPVFERCLTLLHPELTPWWSFLFADSAHHKKPHSPTHPSDQRRPLMNVLTKFELNPSSSLSAHARKLVNQSEAIKQRELNGAYPESWSDLGSAIVNASTKFEVDPLDGLSGNAPGNGWNSTERDHKFIRFMMTLWQRNAFRTAGPLRAPSPKASGTDFRFFFVVSPNTLLNKQSSGWWFETP